MSLTPIQELRYNLKPRVGQGGIPVPPYKYQGYAENRIMPRGSDSRHQKLEQRRMITKDAENVRLIQDRPLQ
tara:strand:- start:169 stop:384 length:216 start_codon:yes stop_codon:yes gene_type:complete